MEKSVKKGTIGSLSNDRKGIRTSKRNLLALGFYLKISLLILLSGQISFTTFSDLFKDQVENISSDADTHDHSSEGEDAHDFEKDKMYTDYETSYQKLPNTHTYPAICARLDAGYLSIPITPPEHC